MNLKNKENNNKSEEVQAIIDRMPTYWVKWVALCVGVLISVVFLLGFVIQYPDTVAGNISITGGDAPVRLVANSSGRLSLLKENSSVIRKNEVIAYIENGANYSHIILIDSLLNCVDSKHPDIAYIPDYLILGEVGSAYNSFRLSLLQYNRLIDSDIYFTIKESLLKKIDLDEKVVLNINKEIVLKEKVLENAFSQLKNDSILFALKGISEQDYVRQQSNYYASEESILLLHSRKLLKLSEISKSKMDLQKIRLEEQEGCDKAYSDYLVRKNELSNALNSWKERYLQYSPIDGELEYLDFWRNNSFITAGEEIFSIIPERNNIIGEVIIPAFGAGKVEIGQTANVKINNFPYDEYGLLKGEVKTLSRLTNKMRHKEGVSEGYLVVVEFPHGMTTNFNKILPLDFETKGSAEIITKRKRLIERLFDNLKAKSEK